MAIDTNALSVFRQKLEDFLVSTEEQILWEFDQATRKCQSPLEQKMLAGLMFVSFGYLAPPHVIIARDTVSEEALDRTRSLTGVIALQHRVGRYIIDFAMVIAAPDGELLRLAIEIDGHEFHEKTKEQAAHDKKRDRALQAAGWRVLRFTGSEVYRDVDACLDEIDDFGASWLEHKIGFFAPVKQPGEEAHQEAE